MNDKFIFCAAIDLHPSSSGELPAVVQTRGKKHLYFENGVTEQFLLVCDQSTGRCTLRASAFGWQKEYVVVDGETEGLLLGERESKIVAAFFELATGVPATRAMSIGDCAFYDPQEESLKAACEDAVKVEKTTIVMHIRDILGSMPHQAVRNLVTIALSGLRILFIMSTA
jgi:hypothetical protein